jgi:hypothetical protein
MLSSVVTCVVIRCPQPALPRASRGHSFTQRNEVSPAAQPAPRFAIPTGASAPFADAQWRDLSSLIAGNLRISALSLLPSRPLSPDLSTSDFQLSTSTVFAYSLFAVHCSLVFAHRSPLPLTPFFATLTIPLQPIDNPATLSPLFATLTCFAPPNSFICNSYKNRPGVGLRPRSNSALPASVFRL